MLKGIGISEGIGIGRALIIEKKPLEIKKSFITDVEKEKSRFFKVVEKTKNELTKVKQNVKERLGDDKAKIFDAHIMILEDSSLLNSIVSVIEEGVNAEYAVFSVMEKYIETLQMLDNNYIRERANDIKEIEEKIIRNLQSDDLTYDLNLQDSIIVADELMPGEFIKLVNQFSIKGIVTQKGGTTSHVAILIRAFEIPACMGVDEAIQKIKSGDLLIVDGQKGEILVNPPQDMIDKYNEEKQKLENIKAELKKYKEIKLTRKNGRTLEIAANIGTVEEVELALKNGADGIGLFRTELLFMQKSSSPNENDQIECYKYVLEKMNGRPVIIRTLDIGADKKLPYIAVKEESNPFLGLRGLRFCLKHKELFITQIRALLKSSIYGNLKIMFPMVSTVEEVIEAKKILEEEKRKLISEGYKISDKIEIGIMIEVPSAAIVSDLLAELVDFFSIGTNDLIQYTLAVDRMNSDVSYLYRYDNEAVLRLIKTTVANAHKKGKWVGVCGEMASVPQMIPTLVQYGVDELSVNPARILETKKIANEVIQLEKSK